MSLVQVPSKVCKELGLNCPSLDRNLIASAFSEDLQHSLFVLCLVFREL